MERLLSMSFLAVLLQVIGRADNWVVLPCTHGVCSRCFTKLVAAQVCIRCCTLTCMSSRLHQHSSYLHRDRQHVDICPASECGQLTVLCRLCRTA